MSKRYYDHLYKIMIIGDSGAGKTCLMNRYASNVFDANFLPTIGVDFKIKMLNMPDGHIIRLQLWDTAGQERFKSLTSQFYRTAHAILLVYDITKLDSFEHVENWARQIREHASDDVLVTLVGNKSDLAAQRRQITQRRGEQLAQRLGMPFVETSAFTGENVDKAFMDIVVLLMNSRMSMKPSSDKKKLLEMRRSILMDDKDKVSLPTFKQRTLDRINCC